MTTDEGSDGCEVAGFEDERRGPGAKECRWPLNLGKARNLYSPLEVLERSIALQVPSETHVGLLTSRIIR